MTDHAAAVEAVRANHAEDEQSIAAIRQQYGVDRIAPAYARAHADRATLLRAYEAVVEEREGLRGELTDFLIRTAKARELQAMLDEQRAVLDAALAWEKDISDFFPSDSAYERMSIEEHALYNAIRAYRAAKETP